MFRFFKGIGSCIVNYIPRATRNIICFILVLFVKLAIKLNSPHAILNAKLDVVDIVLQKCKACIRDVSIGHQFPVSELFMRVLAAYFYDNTNKIKICI